MHIHICIHTQLHTYTHTFTFIRIHTYIHTHIYTHTYTFILIYILRRNKQMNGSEKRVQSINTYTMTFIGNNRHSYWIILAYNNAEKNQFTAINNSLEDAVCIYF